MRYIFIAFFLMFSFSLQAQKSILKAKKEVGYSKLSFEHKEVFLLVKIQKAKEAKDYQNLEDWNLELKRLRASHNFSSKDMLKNGFFVDAMLGIGFLSLKNNQSNTNGLALMPSVRFGNKFYFFNTEKSATGLSLIYLRPSIFYDAPSHDNLVSYSILNIGFSHLSLFKNNKSGIEFSLNGGYNLLSPIHFDYAFNGFNINPNINIQYRKLRFGIDLLSSFNNNKGDKLNINLLSFNFGSKF